MLSHLVGDVVFFRFARRIKGLCYKRVFYIGIRVLDNVDIRNNTAIAGAGIGILGGNTDLIMKESLVFGNVADYGGGIYCSGGASSVNVTNDSGIILNFANGDTSTFSN